MKDGLVWRAAAGELIWLARPDVAGEVGRLCRFEAGEQHQVVGYHSGPDVRLEVVEPAPGAACRAVGTFETGNPGLDAGAEVAQLAVDPRAFGHILDRDAARFVEGDILDAAGLGLIEIVAAGIAAIGGHLPGRRA